jgi:hypothetical protein
MTLFSVMFSFSAKLSFACSRSLMSVAREVFESFLAADVLLSFMSGWNAGDDGFRGHFADCCAMVWSFEKSAGIVRICKVL